MTIPAGTPDRPVRASTEKRPRSLFELIPGPGRWALGAVGHAAPKTEVHPPFRIDMDGTGPDEPEVLS